MKRKWDSEDSLLQQKCIDEVITRIEEIDGNSVGIIAAQDIIDIVTENLAPVIYNRGVNDAKKTIDNKLADLETDLDLLKQR